MANPPKAKGSAYEREIVALYEAHGFTAKRKKDGEASNDIELDVAKFPIECKHRQVNGWRIPSWVRSIQARADLEGEGTGWAIHVADGDRRRADALPDITILPTEMWVALFEAASGFLDISDVLGEEQFSLLMTAVGAALQPEPF